MEIRQNQDDGTPFGRETPLLPNQPPPTWSRQWRGRIEAVGTTPRQRHPHTAADCGEPPHQHGRHPPAGGVTLALDGRTAGRARGHHGRASRRRAFPLNRIKASLRAFQCWEVKVLGFGVKVRPRPQRMALRWYPAPFGLVGANGKACGEAPGVFSPDAPPGCWGVLPHVLTAFMC